MNILCQFDIYVIDLEFQLLSILKKYFFYHYFYRNFSKIFYD